MSMLVSARDEDGSVMSDEEVRDEMFTMLVAGHETTATLMAWVIHRLLENLDILKAARAEVASVVGSGPHPPAPAAEQIARLDYLDAVIKETAPPGSGASPRAWTTSIAAPAPPHHGGDGEASQVPGRPLRTCPALRPRRTAVPQATTGPAMSSSVRMMTSTPRWVLSRLNHAACTLSVYASQPGSPPDRTTLDSGWWPALAGQDSHLLGRVDGFRHVCPSTWHPPSPGFAWRNNRSRMRPGVERRCDASVAPALARRGEGAGGAR